MTNFTKEEQIQAIYDLKAGYTLGHADIAMLKAMARQLLAGLEQAPVVWVMKDDLADIDIISTPAYPALSDAVSKTVGDLIPLYAAPQLPQPGVVDADDNFYSWFGREWHENYQHNQYTTAAKQMLGVMAESAWRAGRSAAMLQGAEQQDRQQNIPENIPTLRDGVAAIRNSGIAIDAGKIQAERDALNDPNLREGWVAVPVEPTAEMIEATFAGEMELQSVQHQMRNRERRAHYYRAMLAAAPQQEVK